MNDISWTADGVTPHPTGGYVHVERTKRGAIRYLDAQRRMHRRGGPAVERADGTGSWWVDDKLHRLDGPAVERADGTRQWWLHNKLHRLDGPAVERADGTRSWWLLSVQMTEEEYAEIVARLREMGEAPDV